MAEELGQTTFKIYLYIYKSPKPVTLREIQRGLGLKSPSLVYYHVKRLKDMGLIREEGQGFVVAKNIIEGFTKIMGYPVPVYLFASIFLFSGLIILLLVYRPPIITKAYIFSLIMNIFSALFFTYLSIKAHLRMKKQ